MRTKYKIDTYQATYFVIDSFEQLFKATAPDFTPIYERVSGQPQIEAGITLPGERTYSVA
jgi:phenylalanine-4-hydroxylase